MDSRAGLLVDSRAALRCTRRLQRNPQTCEECLSLPNNGLGGERKGKGHSHDNTSMTSNQRCAQCRGRHRTELDGNRAGALIKESIGGDSRVSIIIMRI